MVFAKKLNSNSKFKGEKKFTIEKFEKS